MEPQLKPIPINDPEARWSLSQPTTVEAAAPNKVLRNTYWLLALSMLPTIAGAFVGMQLNFAAYFHASPIMAPLLMFGAMIASSVLHGTALIEGGLPTGATASFSPGSCSPTCTSTLTVTAGAATPRRAP